MLTGRGQERVGAGGIRDVFRLGSDVPVKNRGEGLYTAARDHLQRAGNGYLIVL